MKVLFIVHPEEDFAWDMTARMIRGWVALSHEHDRTILLSSGKSPILHELDHIRERWQWGWWALPGLSELDPLFIPTRGLGWAETPFELLTQRAELLQAQVTVVGGGAQECLQAWLDVLSACHIPAAVIPELVYPIGEISIIQGAPYAANP